MGGNEQVDARLSYDWEGLYLIDISLYPHKVGVLIEYEDHLDIMDAPDPRHEVKLRLLKENGWDVITVKYSDFAKNPSKVGKELVATLQEVTCSYQETAKSHQRTGHQRRFVAGSQSEVRCWRSRLCDP